MEWGETDFTFDEDGVEVIMRHVPAWVCPQGDDAAFAPGVADEIYRTVRELVKVAKRAQTMKTIIPSQEYLVRVMA